ncbi:MAG: hypothetical protein M3328_17120, partial [Chloroflexota bacterium]|nr:hypothetical protein [Chloroflexota bacterium]
LKLMEDMEEVNAVTYKDETPLQVAVGGLISGMGGALALTAITVLGRQVMAGPGQRGSQQAAQYEQGLSAGEALSDTPNTPPTMNEVTATFVQKVATGLFGESLSPGQQDVAGLAWHLTYGGFWGMVYALVQSGVRLPQLLLAPIYGLVLWAVGPGWLVPKMKIMLPPGGQNRANAALMAGGHLAYGVLVALGVRLMRQTKA